MTSGEPHCRERLAGLLDDVRREVPFYRECGPELSDFPVTTRKQRIETPEAFYSPARGVAVSDLLAAIARASRSAGVAREFRFDHRVMVEVTSGSSGLPLFIPKTKAERFDLAQLLWVSRRAFDPAASSARYLALINSPTAFSLQEQFKLRTEDGCRRFWRHVGENRIRWIHGTPTILRTIARQTQPADVPGSLAFVETTGQKLTEEDRALITERLRVTIVDQYACREVWAIGSTATGPGFQLNSGGVGVEIVDDDGRAVADGESGRVVVTGLIQRLHPFVRYDTGDRGRLRTEPDGAISLELSPHRPHEMLLGAERPTSGAAAFKIVLKQAYREIGNAQLTHLKIYQQGGARFRIEMDAHPCAEALRSRIEELFNRRRFLAAEAKFELAVLPGEAIARMAGGKETLFSNVAPESAGRAH